MTCGLCQRSQRDGFRKNVKCDGIDTVDECPTKEVPKPSPENELFWQLFQRILPGLPNGMGGYNLEAIETVMNLYQVPEGQRPIIFDKCLAVITVIQEIMSKK